MIMSPFSFIDTYYPDNNALRRMLLVHSWQVASRALLVARRHPELHLDKSLLFQGAMLHDVGIFLTDAPGIHCYGVEPYLLHGCLGGELLRERGRVDLARFCERHTGTGLTQADFHSNGLQVPDVETAPVTLEEQVVCYADKFYSKSSLYRERNAEQVCLSLAKYGDEVVSRFRQWHLLFG